MSDLEQLRVLTQQVRPPAFASLEETARRRDRRAAVTALVGAALVVLLIVSGVLTTRSDDRSIEPFDPDSDHTQTVVDADYGDESVHRFETHEVTQHRRPCRRHRPVGERRLLRRLQFAYWCAGNPDISYLVQVTGGTDDPDHVAVWRAGGVCDGSPEDHGEGYTGTGPPTGPTNSIGSQLTRFSPVPADQGDPTTVRIVLIDRIPDSVIGCFDLPGGPIPAGVPGRVLGPRARRRRRRRLRRGDLHPPGRVRRHGRRNPRPGAGVDRRNRVALRAGGGVDAWDGAGDPRVGQARLRLRRAVRPPRSRRVSAGIRGGQGPR